MLQGLVYASPSLAMQALPLLTGPSLCKTFTSVLAVNNASGYAYTTPYGLPSPWLELDSANETFVTNTQLKVNCDNSKYYYNYDYS